MDRIHSTLLFWKFNCRAHPLEGVGDHAHPKGNCRGLHDVHMRIGVTSRPSNERETFRMDDYTGCWVCKVPSDLFRAYRPYTEEWTHVVVDAWTCVLKKESSQWCLDELPRRGVVATKGLNSPAVRSYMGRKIRVPNGGPALMLWSNRSSERSFRALEVLVASVQSTVKLAPPDAARSIRFWQSEQCRC